MMRVAGWSTIVLCLGFSWFPVQAAQLEMNRAQLGSSAFFVNFESYSLAPAAFWVPRVKFGEHFYISSPLGMTAMKGRFVTSAVADLSVLLGWRGLWRGLSFEAGAGINYMTGAGSSSESFSMNLPRVGLFWGFAERAFLSAVGLRWSPVGSTFQGERGFVAYNRFDVLVEIRL